MHWIWRGCDESHQEGSATHCNQNYRINQCIIRWCTERACDYNHSKNNSMTQYPSVKHATRIDAKDCTWVLTGKLKQVVTCHSRSTRNTRCFGDGCKTWTSRWSRPRAEERLKEHSIWARSRNIPWAKKTAKGIRPSWHSSILLIIQSTRLQQRINYKQDHLVPSATKAGQWLEKPLVQSNVQYLFRTRHRWRLNMRMETVKACIFCVPTKDKASEMVTFLLVNLASFMLIYSPTP